MFIIMSRWKIQNLLKECVCGGKIELKRELSRLRYCCCWSVSQQLEHGWGRKCKNGSGRRLRVATRQVWQIRRRRPTTENEHKFNISISIASPFHEKSFILFSSLYSRYRFNMIFSFHWISTLLNSQYSFLSWGYALNTDRLSIVASSSPLSAKKGFPHFVLSENRTTLYYMKLGMFGGRGGFNGPDMWVEWSLT